MHFLLLADSLAVAVMSYVDHEVLVSCHTGVGIFGLLSLAPRVA